MIRRAAILLGVPVALAVLAAVPLSALRGEYQWLCAAVAVGLVVPPGILTLLASERLFRSSPMGPLLAVVVGTFGRLLLGFGGAALVFFASKPTFHADPISYWAWVLGMYLTTLVVETALLTKQRTDEGLKASGGV